jgi:hypothetical protein
MLADFVERKRQEVGFTLNEELLRNVSLPEPAYMPPDYESPEPEEEEPPPPLPKL